MEVSKKIKVNICDAMLLDIVKNCDVDNVNDVNKEIRGKRCRHDKDSISYKIAMSTMWTMKTQFEVQNIDNMLNRYRTKL